MNGERKKMILCNDKDEFIDLQNHLIKQEGYLWNAGERLFIPHSYRGDKIIIEIWNDKTLTYDYIEGYIDESECVTYQEYMKEVNMFDIDSMFDGILED